MEWNGLTGLVYGLLCGLFELLPVSPQVHQAVFVQLCGLPAPGFGMSMATHLGALAAVVLSYYSKIGKFNWERKIAAQPLRKRKRQPDVVCLMELRLLRIAALPVAVSCIAAPWLSQRMSELWMLSLLAMLNGVLVLLPHYMTRANKDARSISPLDALLVGLGGALGALPGFSRVGALLSVSSMRGADRPFALDFTYMLAILGLAALFVGDLSVILLGADVGVNPFLPSLLAFFGALGAGLAGIRLMRFLAVKNGYESFAYYNWGLAIFAFILYLIG